MNKYVLVGLTFSLALSSYCQAAEKIPCPHINISNLQNLQNSKEISAEGHVWYLKSTYKENHSVLGSYMPFTLSADNIMHAKEITLDNQITDRECQYKLSMPKIHANGYLIFTRVGN